jgi:hypothetical protein
MNETTLAQMLKRIKKKTPSKAPNGATTHK